MTQDIGQGRINAFNYTVQETIELSNQKYLQTLHDKTSDTYAVQLRENGRYSEPVELTHGLDNEEDADQLLKAAEHYGLKQIREALQP